MDTFLSLFGSRSRSTEAILRKTRLRHLKWNRQHFFRQERAVVFTKNGNSLPCRFWITSKTCSIDRDTTIVKFYIKSSIDWNLKYNQWVRLLEYCLFLEMVYLSIYLSKIGPCFVCHQRPQTVDENINHRIWAMHWFPLKFGEKSYNTEWNNQQLMMPRLCGHYSVAAIFTLPEPSTLTQCKLIWQFAWIYHKH